MTWRDKARPIIAAVIEAHGTGDIIGLRRALRDAYPWGPRENHPYQLWCDEIRVQLGAKPKRVRLKKVRPQVKPSSQRELFG